MSEVLDGNSIRRAVKAVEDRKDLILRDSLAPGLAIRVQKGSAAWTLITRETRLSIAPLGAFGKDDLGLLRDIVGRARVMLSEGEDPRPLFKAAVGERDATAAGAKADVAAGKVMRWEQLRDAYLGWALKNKAQDTHRGYRSALGAIPESPIVADFKPLHGRAVTMITTHDLRLVRNNIVKRGQDASGKQVSNIRQAGLTVAALKAAFGWAVEHFAETGLTVNPASELKKPEQKRPDVYDDEDDDVASANERPLTLAEIGLIVLSLDSYPNNAARLALMLQLMTGQRRKTIVQAKRARFLETPDYGTIWALGPDKSGKFRFIPLPDLAAATVKAALSAGRGDSPWLFPQQRLRRAGDEGNGHMAERMLNEVLESLRKPGGALQSAPWVATHALRKAFVSHLNRRLVALGLKDKAPSMITRADEGRIGLDETTYDLDPLLPEKWKLMCEWDRLVKEGCVQAEALLARAA